MPVSRLGQPFEFRLHARPLDLGRGIRVQYYWLDTSLFRRFKSDSSFTAFRNVLGHWAATLRAAGAWDLDDEVHYVAAQCYPLVAESKSLQDVYKDAYLKPGATDPTSDSLSDDARKRIRRVVRARDAALVRAELDHVLGRFEPPARLMTLLQEAFRRWVGRGVVECRRAGAEGLERFLEEIDGWIARYRKKGGNPWVRHFVNLFGYECKVIYLSKPATTSCHTFAQAALGSRPRVGPAIHPNHTDKTTCTSFSLNRDTNAETPAVDLTRTEAARLGGRNSTSRRPIRSRWPARCSRGVA